MTRLNTGGLAGQRDLATIYGDRVFIPDADWLVHLQFRRYAGCPVCNRHLRSIAARHGEIAASGIREVVVFHSRAQTMRELQPDLPFALIADPDKKLYAEFGVETMSLGRIMAPRSVHAVARGLRHAPSLRAVAGRGEEHLGLPADFLIGTDGQVLAAKYGTYVDDQWTVDELLELARAR
ncbi:peroxiredoxin-like family protein [Phytoactinopolyspora halotolerans]|uniref:AhpC/TSA family protein n=1 Tax=Phytoactinopolyspora halotolerans TaxID=1981512 RepID=A0A6L9SDM4_9ACTN|nr:peroxiredoxin-like family protein [Phytoactinopolyspora halotolerans]NEE02601.1 AhpC/TSA family protein [Phytoactinopolyspora halotolerans]